MKFPKIPHLPWSQNIKSDDIRCLQPHVESLQIKAPLIYTEKMDGECTFMSRNVIHARSEDSGYQKPWQTYIKRHWAVNIRHNIPQNIGLFCESLFAIHTIEYEELTDYLFMFGAVNLESRVYFSYSDMIQLADRLGIKPTPLLWEGELKEYPLPDKSTQGSQCEGYVVRNMNSFPMLEFSGNIAKFVRKDHVQSDEHWTKRWKQAQKKGKQEQVNA